MSSIIDAVRTTFSENLGGVAQALAPAHTQFNLAEVPDQSGKTAVVTGGSDGIGLGTVHGLLTKNIAKVFVVSETKEKFDAAEAFLTEELGAEPASRLQWVQLDLGDWAGVKKAAEDIAAATDRIDILTNIAGRGIMTQQFTELGVDRHMAVCHFGHVLLTSYLLPTLKKTAAQGHTVRITNMASNLHQSAPMETKFADLDELNKDYGPNAQYGRAKLAAILYSRYLARHLTVQEPKILVNATHPGIVETKMSRDDIHEPFPISGYAMSKGLQPFKKNLFDGALSTLFAGTATDRSGQYVCPPAAIEPGSDKSHDEALQDQLMLLTKEVLQQKTGQAPPSFY